MKRVKLSLCINHRGNITSAGASSSAQKHLQSQGQMSFRRFAKWHEKIGINDFRYMGTECEVVTGNFFLILVSERYLQNRISVKNKNTWEIEV